MKKFTILLLALALLHGTTFSQSCLPDGITFTTQAEIDNFQTNHPNCTEIEGNVMIDGPSITNLNGLNVLTSIGGYLAIWSTNAMTSLAGLDNLTSIAGGLDIEENAALISLESLDNLTSIDGLLGIAYNNSLTSLTGLENVTSIGGDLHIEENPKLTNLTGLDNVTTIGGYLWIKYNNALTNLTGLGKVHTIGGDLYIGINEALTTLMGLSNLTTIKGVLWINDNYALTSLAGLKNVTSIKDMVWITYNQSLTTLVGLDNIDATSINVLNITDNHSLSTCEVKSVCNYLASTGGKIDIHANATGCNNQEEVETACESASVDEIARRDFCTVYPNPTSGIVGVQFGIVDVQRVILKFYDLHGREIVTFLDGELPPEEHLVRFDVSGLLPGIYFYRLTAGNQTSTGKLVVVR